VVRNFHIQQRTFLCGFEYGMKWNEDICSSLSHCRLRCCAMTDEGCSAVTSALKSNPSHLIELDLSINEMGGSGVKNISDLLMNPQCKLEKLQ